jgi:hypothetical protein
VTIPPDGHELHGVHVVEGDELVLLGLDALHVGGVCRLLGPVDHSQADRELFQSIRLYSQKYIFNL